MFDIGQWETDYMTRVNSMAELAPLTDDDGDDPHGLAEPQARKRPGPTHAMATMIGALRFAMGRSPTPEEALSDGVKFVRAVEAKWPGAVKTFMGGL